MCERLSVGAHCNIIIGRDTIYTDCIVTDIFYVFDAKGNNAGTINIVVTCNNVADTVTFVLESGRIGGIWVEKDGHTIVLHEYFKPLRLKNRVGRSIHNM